MLLGCGFDLLSGAGSAGPPAADVYDLNFRAGATAASLSAAGFGFTRSSLAWDDSFVSYASGVPVITAAAGIVFEETRINSFLQAQAPATRTLSLAAGTYTCWVQGTGSLALSGSRGTATAGSPVTFTLAATTSVTFTLAGALTFAQVENGGLRTSPIITTTGPVTRAAASAPATRAGLAQGTVAMRFRTSYGSASGIQQVAWCIDDGSNANRVRIHRTGTRVLTLTVTSASVDAATTVGTLTDDTEIVVVLAWQSGNFLLKSSLFADATSTAAMPATTPSIERLGSSSGPAGSVDRTISRVALWSTPQSPTNAAAILAAF